MHEMPKYEDIMILMQEIIKDKNKIKKFRKNLWQVESDNARSFLESLLEEFLKRQNESEYL